MKDWKFVQVGNAKTFYIIAPNGEKVEAIDYDQWHYKCVDTGELVEKRVSKLLGEKVGNAIQGLKFKEGDKVEPLYGVHKGEKGKVTGFFIAADNTLQVEVKFADGGYMADDQKQFVKVGNESIAKQEWSMFNGLTKDAEKEIGNSLESMSDEELNKKHREYAQKAVALIREGRSYKEGSKEYKDVQKRLQDIEKQYSDISSEWQKRADKQSIRIKYNGTIGNALTTSDEKQLADMKNMYKKIMGKPMFLTKEDLEKANDLKKKIDYLENEANKKTGNEETKAERKFGKVMGEFEEGSLKTPQGKTVTDPKQAKAIAYSEADKVDNLKRARNAIKKQ